MKDVMDLLKKTELSQHPTLKPLESEDSLVWGPLSRDNPNTVWEPHLETPLSGDPQSRDP